MTNNPTIDGVSRKLIEQAIEALSRHLAGHAPMQVPVSGSDSDIVREELRVLLDAPAVERQTDPDCEWCGGAGHDHYGDPCTACTQVEVAALQSTIAQLQARISDLEKESQRYRSLRTITPYRFKKMQDAASIDGGDVIYFHAERFNALVDARILQDK